MNPAAKLELANRLMEKSIITSPEDYIEFLNRDIYSEESFILIYKLFEEEEL